MFDHCAHSAGPQATRAGGFSTEDSTTSPDEVRAACAEFVRPVHRKVTGRRPAVERAVDEVLQVRDTSPVLAHFAAFLGIATVVIVTPGQDTALTIRNSLLGGRRGGVFTAIGVSSGQAVWALAASVGVTAVLRASHPAFLALKLAGAAYLVFLGAQSLRAAIRGVARHAPAGRSAHSSARTALRQGFVSNLGNPKMAVFFTSLLPQFVPQGRASFGAFVVLGFVFATMTLAWLTAYAIAVARAGDVLRRPRVRRIVDAVTGLVLVAFGVRLAAER
jgi:threonine/homoserine/homoserine lactone efflux protein